MGQVHSPLASLRTSYLPGKTGLDITMIKATYKRTYGSRGLKSMMVEQGMAVATFGSSHLKSRRLTEHAGDGGRLLKFQACPL